jgi:SAM-dependent methyltransferase
LTDDPAEPSLSVVDGLGAAGAELLSHGYTWPSVSERTGLGWRLPYPLSRLDSIDTPDLPDAERPPVDWLIRLFLLGDGVSTDRLDAFLGPVTRDALVAAGLLRRVGSVVTSQALLLPWDGLLLACDWPWLNPTSRVIVPDPSSQLTAEHVPPLPGEPGGTAVDIGSGCGIIAFTAARHFERVRGVDTSPRAVGFARFNAALNGMDVRFELCTEAFLDDELDGPVDLITFVMPVLFPEAWRRPAPAHVSEIEPGVDGARLALGVYRRLPRSLNPGGRALLFHQFPPDAKHDLGGWLDRSGALGDLAVLINNLSEPDSREAFARVSVHRADGDGSVRLVPGPADLLGGAQTRADLVRRLETEARLADGAVADAVPRVYGWVEATTDAPVADGRLEAARRRLDGQPVGDAEWRFAHAIDGRSTVAEVGRRADVDDAEAAARSLAAAGLVYLTPAAGRR